MRERNEDWNEDTLDGMLTAEHSGPMGSDEARSLGGLETRRRTGSEEDGRTDAVRRRKAGETILGRYVIEGELGQGGMGVVYACLDKVGGVRVAVKCLPPELNHESAEMEEVRENFQLVYGLTHPNLAAVKQLEQDDHGEYFLVMELAEGVPLRRWMRRRGGVRSQEPGVGRIPLEEAIPVLRQVASALDYAHSKKVVHRDIKPGNVMISADGEVKVLDFGLAAQIWASMSRASQANLGASGTGPYMAPEQWKAQPQDAKTDQYALAVMAYEMLAGRLPFESSDPDLLKTAVLGGKVPEVKGLDRRAMGALLRAMDKVPGNRFASCSDFVDALACRRCFETSGKWLAFWCCTVLAVLMLAILTMWRLADVSREDSTEGENVPPAGMALPESPSAESVAPPFIADPIPESVEEVLDRANESKAKALAIQDKNRAAIAAVEEFKQSDLQSAP